MAGFRSGGQILPPIRRAHHSGITDHPLVSYQPTPARSRPPLFTIPRPAEVCMQPLLNIAVRAARRAGEIIVRGMNRVHRLDIRAKGQNDFVTEIDMQAERDIIETIHKHYPDHAILAEESGPSGSNEEFTWIIDPLDGTTNFLHGFPQFAVSIGVQRRGRMEHAVVYDPLRQELFTTSRGEGAQLDGKRIRVSSHVGLDRALIGTGFPYRSNLHWLDSYMAMLKSVTMQTAGIRRPGSAALDLAYVAAGRLDAFWELGLSPWDTAAGMLLITEAGGLVGTITGAEYNHGGHIVGGTPKVYSALLEVLAPHVPPELRT
jgi:myo-inositol-1(or 4)-monophosphatase